MSHELDAAFARLADGDRRAFDAVFERAWPSVHRLCVRALGDGPDAEDAAQTALEKVFTRAHQFEPGRSALAWIVATASWEIRSVRARRRREAVRGAGPVSEATADPAPSPEDTVIAADLLEAAGLALSELGPSDRALVESACSDEPVALPGVAQAAARKRRQRALERLRVAWRLLHGR